MYPQIHQHLVPVSMIVNLCLHECPPSLTVICLLSTSPSSVLYYSLSTLSYSNTLPHHSPFPSHSPQYIPLLSPFSQEASCLFLTLLPSVSLLYIFLTNLSLGILSTGTNSFKVFLFTHSVTSHLTVCISLSLTRHSSFTLYHYVFHLIC